MAAVPPSHPGPTSADRQLHIQRILAMQFVLFEALEHSGCRAPVILIGSDALTLRYTLGLQHLGIACQSHGAEATWAGLFALASACPHTQPFKP